MCVCLFTHFYSLFQNKVTRAAQKDGSIDPRVLRMFQYYLQCCMAASIAGEGLLYQVWCVCVCVCVCVCLF